jgi:hypothetical protein
VGETLQPPPEATGIVDSTAASDDWKRKSKKRKN